MTSRRVAVGVGLAGVAGLVAWLLLSRGSPEAVAPSEAPVASRTRSGTTPEPATRSPPERPAPAPPDAPVVSGDTWLLVVNAADGKPLEGAQVSVSRIGTRRHHLRSPDATEVTDAQGRAAFAGLKASEYDLAIFLPYFHQHRGAFSAGATVALEPIPVLRGRVLTRERTPASGALVTSTGVESASVRAGPDGRFVLRAPMVDQLVAEKDGQVGLSRALRDDELDLNAELEIVLGASGDDALRVVGRDGAPLAGVEVQILVRAVRLHQTTGADGAFKLPRLDDVFVEVRFQKSGYVTLRESFMRYTEREDVVLSRPTHLEGTLVELDGRPVAGASVSVVEPYDVWMRPEPVTTDRHGRFEFKDLPFERVHLRALAGPGHWAEDEVELPEGKTVRVTMTIRPELRPVKFEVVTGGGHPATDFVLVATPVPPAGWSSRVSRFGELELNRGRFHFRVVAEDGRTGEVTLDVDPRPDMEPLRFVVRGDGGQEFEDELPAVRVPVLVVSAAGTPVKGAEVACYDASGVTGDDGRFTCEVHAGDHAWPLQITASKDGATGVARATGKEGDVRVVVRSQGTLRGRVDGVLPPSDLSLVVNTAADRGTFPLTGNAFALEGRPPIRTFVCVVHAPERSPETTLGCSVSEAGEELVIPVGSPGTLSFTAVTAAGAPLAEPIVYVDRTRQTVDAAPGGVKLELPPGQHVLVLNQADSRARYEQRFSIATGQVTALGTLKLQVP